MQRVDRYSVTELKLGSGDYLVLTSDGVTEAGLPRSTPFGLARATELIHEECSKDVTALELVDSILNAVLDDNPEQADDMTCLVAKRL